MRNTVSTLIFVLSLTNCVLGFFVPDVGSIGNVIHQAFAPAPQINECFQAYNRSACDIGINV